MLSSGRIYIGASGSMAPALRYQGALLKIKNKKSEKLTPIEFEWSPGTDRAMH